MPVESLADAVQLVVVGVNYEAFRDDLTAEDASGR